MNSAQIERVAAVVWAKAPSLIDDRLAREIAMAAITAMNEPRPMTAKEQEAALEAWRVHDQS